MQFLDGHAHLALTDGAVTRLLNTMDQTEISHAVVVAGGNITPCQLSENILTGEWIDVDVDNLAIKALTDTSEGRLLPFFFANPRRGSAPYREQGQGFFGLKLGPAVHGVALTDERTLSLCETATEFGQPVYLHCLARPGFFVSDLVEVAKQFPQTTFILGHAGIGNCDFYAISLIKPYTNIFFETSGGFSLVIKTAVRELGAYRVIFGTEYPIQHPGVEISKMRYLDLSPEDFQAVTYGNMQKLLTAGGAHV